MPRSSVVLSQSPLDGDSIVAAAAEVWATAVDLDPVRDAFDVRAVDDGAVLQVIAMGTVVLSVLRPRKLPNMDEVQRLLPAAAHSGIEADWWGEAYTPWATGGEIGVAILDVAARRLGGRAWHAGLTPQWKLPSR